MCVLYLVYTRRHGRAHRQSDYCGHPFRVSFFFLLQSIIKDRPNNCIVNAIHCIESIQRYFTKRIIGCLHLSYVERFKNKLNLPSLSYRRMRGDMIDVFKIAHNFYDPQTTAELLKFHPDPSTRSNGYKIVKVATNTTKSQPGLGISGCTGARCTQKFGCAPKFQKLGARRAPSNFSSVADQRSWLYIQ